MVRIPTLALSLLAVGCASVRSVDEGAVYRSGQLTAKQLDDVIRTKGIKTVVNLRGMQPGRQWYRDEQEVCERNGVEMIDVSMDGKAPDRGEVAALLDAYHNAPKPILVHSWSNQGSAGLASGLYRSAINNESPDRARGELAWWQSSRIPIRAVSEHDRFLKEWRGERDFFATYQLAGRDDLPDLADRAIAVLKPSLPPEYGGSPDGPQSPGGPPLPPPALELFSGQSLPNAPVAYADAPPANSAPEHQSVVWFGRPIEIDE